MVKSAPAAGESAGDLQSVGAFLAAASARLAAAGIGPARREARLLLAQALGEPSEMLLAYPERVLTAQGVAAAWALLERRAAREPLSRIAGEREFWGLTFRLSAATLDPRPDTETLVEAALARFPDRQAPLRVIDLGCGSGCLLLALLSELPRAWGLGLDLSPEAAAMAAANARELGLAERAAFLAGDWDAALGGESHFDLVVSNPPYIESAAIAGLEPEVAAHDPRRALDGGPDGLGAYRRLAPALARLLAPGGLGLLEMGAGQGEALGGLLTGAGLRLLGAASDLGGWERCLLVTPKGPADREIQ